MEVQRLEVNNQSELVIRGKNYLFDAEAHPTLKDAAIAYVESVLAEFSIIVLITMLFNLSHLWNSFLFSVMILISILCTQHAHLFIDFKVQSYD